MRSGHESSPSKSGESASGPRRRRLPLNAPPAETRRRWNTAAVIRRPWTSMSSKERRPRPKEASEFRPEQRGRHPARPSRGVSAAHRDRGPQEWTGRERAQDRDPSTETPPAARTRGGARTPPLGSWLRAHRRRTASDRRPKRHDPRRRRVATRVDVATRAGVSPSGALAPASGEHRAITGLPGLRHVETTEPLFGRPWRGLLAKQRGTGPDPRASTDARAGCRCE